MGYRHIENLRRNQTILMFKECWAMEKIHGTSAHIRWDADHAEQIKFYSGGEKHEKFVSLFDIDALRESFLRLGRDQMVVYGEAYGGKQQGMSKLYGPQLCFVVFEVMTGADTWLNVPNSAGVAESLGLEFVPFQKCSTDLDELTALRDAPSRIAVRRGCEPAIGEGLVLKPLQEFRDHRNERIIVKYKTEQFSERKSKKDTKVEPARAEQLTEAEAIANEWVTDMRLRHVIGALEAAKQRSLASRDIPALLAMMQEDVTREGGDELVMSQDAARAIKRKTVELFNAWSTPESHLPSS